MRVFNNNELALDGSVVTIGTFDGVHQGHQTLIKKANARAQELNVPSVVYTFDPPPRAYFQGKMVLTTCEAKLDCLSALDVDYTIVANFNKQYASRTPEDFIQELKKLDPCEVWVGANFTFGKQKQGNVDTLSEVFKTVIHPLVTCQGGEVISSTRIRKLIQADEPHLAEQLLGRDRMARLQA